MDSNIGALTLLIIGIVFFVKEARKKNSGCMPVLMVIVLSLAFLFLFFFG